MFEGQESFSFDQNQVQGSLADGYRMRLPTKFFLSNHAAACLFIKKSMEKKTIPLFLQRDNRWGEEEYGDGTIASDGCGPTALAMVIAGLSKRSDIDPKELARYSMRKGFYVKGIGSAWTLMTQGALDYGIQVQTMAMVEDSVMEQLNPHHPIICSVGPGDFTDAGHFIVLVNMDAQGQITIHDSNSCLCRKRTYSFALINKQVRQAWVYWQ